MKILFIHGAGGGAYAEDEKLVQSLRESLDNTYEIIYPEMPQPDAPDYEPWKSAILDELEKLDEPMILVGHSFGGSVLLKYLAENEVSKSIIGIYIISAPFWGGDKDWQYDGFTLPDVVSVTLSKIPKYFYHANDDEIVSFSHLQMYKNKFPDSITREIEEGGHQLGNDLTCITEDIIH